jgi:hypothetical protein
MRSVKCREVNKAILLVACDYFIRCVLTILLGVIYYGCFNFVCFVICVCVFVICIYLHLLCFVIYVCVCVCSVCVLIFIVL